MTWLIRRFRWVIIASVARFLARVGLKRSLDHKVDKAKADIESRLPTQVVKAADKLPIDIVRAGGAAVVAGQTSRALGERAVSAGAVAKRAIESGANLTGSVLAAGADLKQAGNDLASEIRAESDHTRREIKADIARDTQGEAAALEALLDVRDAEAEPIPEVGNPIQKGRRRFRPSLPTPPVNRMQRTYRRPVKPWDRGSRRKRAAGQIEPSQKHRDFGTPDHDT